MYRLAVTRAMARGLGCPRAAPARWLRAPRPVGLAPLATPSSPLTAARRPASTSPSSPSPPPPRSVTDLDSYPPAGEKLHGFTVLEKKHVPELHLTAIHLRHDKTAADYLHVARDDANNVFGIGFKTNPPDATGVPHILEHTTLCGSEKYPVRDPFFKMLPRSLSNFMNAFTSSDHTTYPFATTNRQDFKNLLSVYLDATLHPLLKIEDFRQEGWRLAPATAPTPTAPQQPQPDDMVFKGVVYNEMKGQISDANYLYYVKCREQIIPALNNSGGDPQYITDLTHQQLVDYSRRNYHPSNAKIMTYGDMPLMEHLEHIGAVLDGFSRGHADQEVKVPKDLSNGPHSITIDGPIDTFASADKQHKTSLSWLAGDAANIVESFGLNLLSSLLLDGYGSPMYKALIESGIGSSFTPNTGLDTSGKIPIFSVGATGVSAADAALVPERVKSALHDVVKSGFNDDKVQGILHQLELALRHKTANFGMGILDKVIGSWLNGSHPMKELAWNDVINEFKALYAQGGYLESLAAKYLLNDNYLTFTMVGSEKWSANLEAAEQARRTAKIAELAAAAGSQEAAVRKLVDEELELLRVQESAQKNADLSCLPTLHVRDIARTKEEKPVRESKLGTVDVLWREAPTNGLTYFQALNTLRGLPNDLRLLMPLFNDCVMRLGTESRTMEQWEDLMKLKTGGISTSSFLVSLPHSISEFQEGLQCSGYAMDKNFPEMLEMIRALVTETNFNATYAPAMVQELLRSATNGALDAVASAGHRFAAGAASAGLGAKGWVAEQQGGLAQIQATAQLLRDAETSPEKLQELIQKLQVIQQFAIANSDRLRIRVVCEPTSSSANEAALQKWLGSLPAGQAAVPPADAAASSFPPLSAPAASKILYQLPYQVSYTGLALPTVPFTDPASAPLSVLSQLLTHNFLHPEIREKGGAYGASASNAPLSGQFTLTSYRDPNPLNTLGVFSAAGAFARDRAWTPRELEEAKLGIFQGLDAPRSVDSEGQRRFMSGVTHAMDQAWREQVLDVTAQDVGAVAQRFLVDEASTAKAVFVMLGEMKDGVAPDRGWQVRKVAMGAPQQAEHGGAGNAAAAV